MNYNENKVVKQPEHFEIASKMALDINSFSPDQQNEMVNLIFGQVLQRREELIKEASERLEYLKASINPLTK